MTLTFEQIVNLAVAVTLAKECWKEIEENPTGEMARRFNAIPEKLDSPQDILDDAERTVVRLSHIVSSL